MNNLAKKQRWIPQYPVYKIVTELQLNALEGHLFKVRLRVDKRDKPLKRVYAWLSPDSGTKLSVDLSAANLGCRP